MSIARVVARIVARGRHVVRHVARRGPPGVSVVPIVIPDLPAAFEGYRIAALSDFHHPAGGDLTWLRQTVDVVDQVSPDLVVLLGDYGESFKRLRSLSRHWYRQAMSELTPCVSSLRARDGIVAVLGNHDYYADAATVLDWLASLGVHVLVNEARYVSRGAHRLRVAGMDDVFEGHPDRTVGCDIAGREPTIVLSHNPDGVLRLHPDLRVDAAIAGHTHGGQVVVPWYGAPLTMARVCSRRAASGWIPNTRTPLYVTRGLGEQLPLPLRFNCPRELLIARLTASAQQPA